MYVCVHVCKFTPYILEICNTRLWGKKGKPPHCMQDSSQRNLMLFESCQPVLCHASNFLDILLFFSKRILFVKFTHLVRH